MRSQTAEELESQFRAWGQPAYRVKQLLEWLYAHHATSWEAMTNLPKALREELRRHYSLTALELVRKQGARGATQKFLWRLGDGALIESVLMPANPALYGEASDRHTLCVSTQVGCAYGCTFCASGLAGWKRNLRVEEIVEQVLAVERWNAWEEAPKSAIESPDSGNQSQKAVSENEDRQDAPRTAHHASSAPRGSLLVPQARLVSNLVIMGMGEPLANFDNLLKALRILNAPWGGGIGARKMTISTSGLAPQIRRLAEEPLQFRLAVSLHGATDETRSRLMPVNRKYPLRELAAACEEYQRKRGRMITFEYILIAGVNDGLDQVKPLAALAHRLKAKVNLIPYNRVEGLPWERPTEEAQEAFLRALAKQKVKATLRREKGGEIDAACGQLRLKTERELARAAS
ncbi:MAG TPA: 23S rRNA (adenine(2503)-C(2))-methyltransferase RlmN [Verrucomicrobiota bacterium]|nr:23S rRNA (adenine(2503)-C(2))-methyltransferase RlmN [Verrucomicrobiota bacterium]HQL77770.1 23S rRNA (adenine(2503)-C(2))-methyltransferase RlmN [Verrucomicrobiota bacterium]